jgi:hypothetical protein
MSKKMTMPAQPSFDWLRPDYLPIYRQRTERLRKFRASSPADQAAVVQFYKDSPAAFISDWGLTHDPRNPERGLPASVPFVLFPRQVELIDFVLARWKRGEPGLIEKSRDVGASWLIMALSVTLCILNKGLTVGVGSRKEQLLDNAGDPSSLFFKARAFHQSLPPEFRGQMATAHMRLTFAETGSAIVGEAGDQIGRGGRASLYFVDESAFLERPEMVESSLSATTNCRIDLSSVNGLSNPFASKRFGGKVPVFTFHWRSDPRKDDAWYQRKSGELPAHVIASELDLNYRGSVDNQLILPQWINAAIDAHTKLGIEPSGGHIAGLDVADQGKDNCALAARHGVLLNYLKPWSGKDSDIYKTTVKTFGLCDELGLDSFFFDQDGLGAGVAGDANAINVERAKAGKAAVTAMPFRGSAGVWNPDGSMVPGRKNKDFFANMKAQAWWHLRARFEVTFKAVVERLPFDPDDIISIDSTLPELLQLQMELSQPTFSVNAVGKILVDKQPDGMPSPNLADSVMIAYQPASPDGFFSTVMGTGTKPADTAAPSPADYPQYVDALIAVVAPYFDSQPFGLGVLYCAVSQHQQDARFPAPLVIVDWDLGLLEPDLRATVERVYRRLDELRALCRVRGASGLWCEPAGLGPALYGAAIDAGHGGDVYLVPETLARLDLATRALDGVRYVAEQKTHVAAPARAKRTNFRGLTQNWFVEELAAFNITRPDPAAALASTFYLATLLALEDPPRQ